MHGNAVAFRAALADLERDDVDLIVSLGDVAQGGPQPRECVELLRELGCPCVFGNSDDFLLTLDFGSEESEDPERVREVGEWSRQQLGDEGLAFLRSFQPIVEVDLDGVDVVCCHATPDSNEHVVLPETPPSEVPARGDVVAAGHVHRQWLRRFGSTLWLCGGSVGLVYENDAPPFLPWAEYALLTGDGGRVAVDFRRIPFDVEELVAAAGAANFPRVDEWARDWQR
jgi:predicted phosphodiesterase